MKVVTAWPQVDNRKIYGREVVFKLENFNNVKMIYLQFKIACNATGGFTLFPTPFCPYIIRTAVLESYGAPIALVSTSYTLGRMSELSDDIYDQLANAANIQNGVLNATAQTVSMPLYFWTFDGNVLDINKYKGLTIRVITKDSKEDMGTDKNITSMEPSLKVIYGAPSKELDNPYNVYRNITYFDAVNTKENVATVRMKWPNKISNLYFMIRQSDNARISPTIKSIELSDNIGVIGEFTSLNNYTIGATGVSNRGEIMAIQLSNRRDKDSYGSFLMAGARNPTVAKLKFDSVNSTQVTIYAAYEYYSDIVESEGRLLEEMPNSVN